MSSRLLAAVRLAAAKFAGNRRTATNLPAPRLSLEEFFSTLKREIQYPATRAENQG